MRVLLIKMSSLGDVFHTFPAITDALQAIPDLKIDWVVEEGFAQIPAWHPAVDKVLPIGLRRWRRSWLNANTRNEIRGFLEQLRQTEYDLVLDAQGLIKSALVTWFAKGLRVGLDAKSAREPLASRAYQRKLHVPRGAHAIPRLRQLFAQCFGYALPSSDIDYGIDAAQWPAPATTQPYLVFLHGTTWETKLWPEPNWPQLCALANQQGFKVLLPWGNEEEQQRAQRIAAQGTNVEVLPKLSLTELAQILGHARGVVGVDTGLSHVAAALNVPTIAIYGATDPELTGVLGPKVELLRSYYQCAPCLSKTCKVPNAPQPPCYDEITPQRVWQALSARLSKGHAANI